MIIKKRFEILEGFSVNAISNEKFVDNICTNFRTEFEKTLSGLLVDDILMTEPFKSIPQSDRKISKLNRFNLKYLSYKLALAQLPKIVGIIKKLSSKDMEVRHYTIKQKFSKYKPKILSFLVFFAGTLLPLILPLFG